jgi:hypothetical protein
MVYVAGDRYLWASDFVQSVAQPTQYGGEVLAAARRVGIAPISFAAEHLPLTPWERLVKISAP